MKGEFIQNQNNTSKSANGLDGKVCPECQLNPCICQFKSVNTEKELSTKIRVKGSHRFKKPPKLKWI